MHRMRWARAAILITGASVFVVGCGDSGAEGEGADEGLPACVEIDYEGCALLYSPTYDEVWSQTLSTSCSGGGAACHMQTTGGLTFLDQASSYDLLISGDHVIPGDAACSPLMVRLESEDPSVRMPPGNTPISEQARCSIATWIDDGAPQD